MPDSNDLDGADEDDMHVRTARLARSDGTFIRALELLVTQDREWVPAGMGDSLYLRPFMIATQRGLGFTLPVHGFLFCVIASPVSAYFGGGAKPRPVTV